jgi:coproporphyrinogen III oxidase-like Fe-S oxidoreductase
VLKARGLTREENARWRLTDDGVFLANDVFREFVPPFQLQEASA